MKRIRRSAATHKCYYRRWRLLLTLLPYLYQTNTHSFRLEQKSAIRKEVTASTLKLQNSYCNVQKQRRTITSSAGSPQSPLLYMYVIEDNHDHPPGRIFQSTTVDSENNIDNSITGNEDALYQKKVEYYFRREQYRNMIKKDWRDEWGVEYHYRHDHPHLYDDGYDPKVDVTKLQLNVATGSNTKSNSKQRVTDIGKYFPSTIDEVANAVVATIMAVVHPSTITKINTNPDPNILQNTVHGDNVMMSRRPVRHPQHDMGRIGIELDWSTPTRNSRRIQPDTNMHHNNHPDKRDYATVRYASLIIAGKLSNQPNPTYNYVPRNSNIPAPKQPTMQHRPIAIYYNTVQQALAASQQLWHIKRLELLNQPQQESTEKSSSSNYDAIHIRCLGQGDGIPDELMKQQNLSSTKLGRQLSTGSIDPMTSMILIVQPTNYNDEFRPPGPSIGVIESIQRLITMAAIEQIPVIMISPRFLKAQQQEQQSVSSISGGWDQSGYYQQSSLYAGLEPPQGPTPWILRDFTPPVFCYVASALLCDTVVNDKNATRNENDNGQQLVLNKGSDRFSYYSHLSLWQSVLHQGHTWNLYAATQRVPTTAPSSTSTGNNLHNKNQPQPRFSYDRIATCKNSAGRPTRQLMRQIWNEYCITAK